MPQSGKFVYTTIDDKTAGLGTGTQFESCNGFVAKTEVSGVVVIPGFIDGYRIVSLLSFSVNGCAKMSKLVFPNTLLTLEYGSFSQIRGIKEITIPASVIKIGDNNDAFHSIKKFNFEKGSRLESIGNHFLRISTLIEEITIPYTVTYIGSYFANGCTSLKRVSYCGKADLSSFSPAFSDSNNVNEVIVSYEYTAASFGGKSITQKAFGVCFSLPERKFSCANKRTRGIQSIQALTLITIFS